MDTITNLKSTDFKVIKKTLLTMLQSLTDKAVLDCDDAFYGATDKHAFYAQFETTSDRPATRPAELLEKWTHYCWLRLEISYLAKQKAALNEQQQFSSYAAMNNHSPEFPALTHSVSQAIQEDFFNGVAIEDSIKTLRQVVLQIVGTEHPTDPLSQRARELLTQLSVEISSHNTHRIIEKLKALLEVDSIPPFRRDVEEEVNRNITITMDKLYEALPYLVDAILSAYKTYYGDELFQRYEMTILTALEGGLQPDGSITKPIVRDASWAGFDADGNANMKPDVMKYALRLHRITAAEKHSEVLNKTLIRLTKENEQTIRSEIKNRHIALYKALKDHNASAELLEKVHELHLEVMESVADDKFKQATQFIQQEVDLLKRLDNATDVLDLLAQQLQAANRLIDLTAFSGESRDENGSTFGDLQSLDDNFKKYKARIRTNTDDIEINGLDATEYISQRYKEIISKHANFIQSNVKLSRLVRYFAIQLRCYGMTYGVGHIRQDSSVYSLVWDTLLLDLQQDKDFPHLSLLSILQNKKYSQLPVNEKLKLQKTLQNPEHGILAYIYKKHHDRRYHVKMQEQPKSHYTWVCDELERIEVALRHRDVFENIIISNSESAANIFEVKSLMKIFPTYHENLVIVPLLEKRADLENYEYILTDLIKIRIYEHFETAYRHKTGAIIRLMRNSFGCHTLLDLSTRLAQLQRHDFKKLLKNANDLKAELKTIVLEVMCGFSDTERVSGLTALISIQQVQEDIIDLASDFGVAPKFYFGPGGDINRGGLRRRDEKATLQGNARSNVLNTLPASRRYRETQFYHVYKLKSEPATQLEFKKQPAHIKKWIAQCGKDGATFYENLHNTEHKLGKAFGHFLGHGAHWLVTMLNSSSRANQRGISENHGDRTASVQKDGTRPDKYIHPDKPRAITATQMKEVLRDYVGVLIGPGYALQQLGKDKAIKIFDASETVRDMFFKMLTGYSLLDLSFVEFALFADNKAYIPKDTAEMKQWANEYIQQSDSFDAHMATTDKAVMLYWLSRLYAFIKQDLESSKALMVDIMKTIYREQYKAVSTKAQRSPTDVLLPFPTWQRQTDDTIRDLMPLSYLLARQNVFVMQDLNLDEVYLHLNDNKQPHSKLTGVGRLLGNLGAGITAGRIMAPGYFETLYLQYKSNLAQGVTRADTEFNALNRNGLFSLIPKATYEQNLATITTQSIRRYRI